MTRVVLLLLLGFQFSFSQNLLLKNVNVIPVNTNTVLTNMNVYITNGVIDKIVSGSTKLPFKDYPVVEAKGKYIIPGLADMHAHFPDSKSPVSLNDYFTYNLAAGVTLLRSMRGEESQLALRDKIQKQQQLAPDIYVSYVFPGEDSLLNKDKIFDLIFQAKIKKYDFIKYLGGLKPKRMDELSQACYEYKIPLAGHAYNKSLDESVAHDFASIEHYQSLLAAYEKDEAAFDKTLKLMKDKNTAVCPTLSFYYTYSFMYSNEQLLSRNGMTVVSQGVKDAWQKEYDEALTSTKEQLKEEMEAKYTHAYRAKFEKFNAVLKKINAAKVILLVSADEGPFNVPGFSMAEEMNLYAKAGLSNYDILKAATLNAYQFLNCDKTLGTIAEGKRANMVLLNANPLENIENVKQVEGTILNGKYHSQASLLGISK